MEEWKSLEFLGLPYHHVSSEGRIKSLRLNKILTGTVGKIGYKTVTLQKGKVYKIHRLVAMAFIEGDWSLDVNHLDGNKLNNHRDNLEWCTRRENQIHAIKTGLKKVTPGVDRINCKLTVEDIKYIKDNYIKSSREFGQRALAEKFKVTPTAIWGIVNGKTHCDI